MSATYKGCPNCGIRVEISLDSSAGILCGHCKYQENLSIRVHENVQAKGVFGGSPPPKSVVATPEKEYNNGNGTESQNP
jgi:hypothetical protein